IYILSLHDALPISHRPRLPPWPAAWQYPRCPTGGRGPPPGRACRRGLLVALLARLQALLDRVGELGLASVVGHPGIDLGGERLVIGPDRADQALAEDFGPGDQADPGGQHFLPDAGRGDLDADVVVTALPRPPRSGRVVAHLRAGLGAPAGQVLHRGRDLLDE